MTGSTQLHYYVAIGAQTHDRPVSRALWEELGLLLLPGDEPMLTDSGDGLYRAWVRYRRLDDSWSRIFGKHHHTPYIAVRSLIDKLVSWGRKPAAS